MPPPDVPVLRLDSTPHAHLVTALRVACERVGFFYVEDHGVPVELMDEAFAASAALFALPPEVKATLRATPATNNRGWTELYEETLDPAHQVRGDTKEGYYIGREVDAGSAEAALPLHGASHCVLQGASVVSRGRCRAGPNVWPPEHLLPGWRATMERYFAACRALGMRIARLLGEALDLEPGFFDQPGRFDRPQLFLRLLRYAPEVSAPEAGVFAAGAHSDYGMLTLLATDANPGLQIQPRAGGADGDWFDVPPRRGAFIVNLGDMLERWTNGLFLSTRHRVVNTTGAERLSMPFFFEPNFECVVECLPQCCSADRPPRFSPTTAGEYLLSRYGATHAAYGGAPRAAA